MPENAAAAGTGNIGIGSFDATSDSSSSRALPGDVFFAIVIKGAINEADLNALEAALTKHFKPAP